MTSPGTAASGAIAGKAGVTLDDDPNAYRTEPSEPMEVTPALAARFDAAIREAMQHRVPGWLSPSRPAGAESHPVLPNVPR